MNATFYDYKNNAPHETDEDHPAEGEFVGGYTTSILGNKSVEWVKNTAREPFSLVVGHRAPHIPATPAPWYENEFANLTAPRDAAYNASDLSRFHWLIAQQPPITQEQGKIIDELFRNRWRCLLSVVDATLALLDALDLSSTYVFYTSDNGYNLGQHRLPSCKLNVYDHDLRVPMGILGPGVRRGEKINFLASSHLDIKPTILSLVNMTCSDEDECEGVDLSPFILSAPYNVAPPTQVQIEYYSLGNVTRTGHLVDDTMSNTYRGERSVPPHALGDFLYAEFTAFSDWDFEHPTFFEAFNLTRDPHQLDNILFSEK